MSIESSANKAELEKFRKISDQWWKEDGEFKMLHQINPIRLSYILEKMRGHFGIDGDKLDILDVGCGGGLITSKLCEYNNTIPSLRLNETGEFQDEFAQRTGVPEHKRDRQNSLSRVKMRLGITGIDAVQENVDIAAEYARQHNLDIIYKRSTIEEFASSNTRLYDVVLCLEVIEHVDNPSSFVKNLTSLVKPNGMVIMSTINRTYKAYLLAIIMAEYVLNWVPRKTHDYSKFLKPSEINSLFKENGMELTELKGLTYNLHNNSWQLSNDIDVNYFAYFTKKDN